MNGRTILFQHACGEPWQSLLAISAPWHKQYAARHGMEYVLDYSLVERHGFDMSSMSVLAAVKCLNEMADSDILILLDTDALIVKPEVDLRTARPLYADIALCGGPHWTNSGMTVIFNSALSRTFYRRVLALGPITASNEQIDGRIQSERLVSTCPAQVAIIGDKWNWYDSYGAGPCRTPDCPREDAVVLAWHGVRDKREVTAPLTAALNLAIKRAA